MTHLERKSLECIQTHVGVEVDSIVSKSIFSHPHSLTHFQAKVIGGNKQND